MSKRIALSILLSALMPLPGFAAGAKLIPGTSNELPRLATSHGMFKLGKKPYPPGTRAKWIAEGRALAKAPAGYLPRRKTLKGAADNRSLMPPIGNQSTEGSCVHWAGSYYTKSANMKRLDPSLNLSAASNQCSPRFTYNLTNCGQDNGGYGHEPFEIFMRYGAASLAQKPYVAGNFAALPTMADFVEGLHRRTTNYVWLWDWDPDAAQIAELKAHLDAGGVAACGVYAETSFDAWGPGDAPWYGTPCTINSINHMVTVCGYGTGYYLVANQWGTSFGSNGFIVVDSGYFENYFSDVMYPLEGSYAPATNYAKIQISHARRSDVRSLAFSVNGTTVWSNSPLPKDLPLGTGSFDTDTRANWQLAVDLSAAPWVGANVVTARCMDRVSTTSGSLTNFTLRYAGSDCVSTNTPVAIPDNTGVAAVAAVRTPVPAFAVRPWPDTSLRIVPFADQLPGGLNATQRWFAATRFAGTQKMLRSEIRALRAYNTNFLCLHYQLAVGAGPAAFVVGDSWDSDWSFVDAQTSWFLRTADDERVHQTQWNWDVMDVRYDAGEAVTGFPDYWISNCIERIRAAEDDGVFADSFTPDGYGFGQSLPPHPWLEDVDLCLANWVPSLEQFGAEAREALAGAGGFVFLPNLGGLVTSWLDMDYGLGDGGMIEGFAFWGPGSYFDPSDWELQMDRALALVRSNKIVICQAYPAADGAQERMFATASHFLVKGSRTYLNLLSSGDVALEYYPEYAIDLGGALGAFPSGIDALWHSGWGVYRRDYSNGIAVVNPTAAAVNVPDLGATYWRVVASGGGVVGENLDYGGALSAVETTNLSLPAYSGAVLLHSNPYAALAISPPLTNVSAAASTGRQVAVTANVPWTAAANAPWLSISAGASGSGNGAVVYAVASNLAASARTGTIAVAGGGMVRTCTVVQAERWTGAPWAMPGTVEMEDFNVGGQGVAYNDTTATNEGGVYRPLEGVDVATMTEAGNGYVVGWTPAGEWLEYAVDVASPGTYAVEVSVAAIGTGGQFRVLINGADKTGLLDVPDTGAWYSYQSVWKPGVTLSAGIQTVRVSLATAGTSGNVGAFDWFRISDLIPNLSINPALTNVPSSASTGRQIAVAANVPWTAGSDDSWISVTDGSSGATNGTVAFSVATNAGTSSRTGEVVVAGGGMVRTCTVVQAWSTVLPVVSRSAVNVRESGEGRFFVRLDRAPETDATVTVARVSGDADLTVKSGASLVFKASNWSAWQRVTLAAADDDDSVGDAAAFAVSTRGASHSVVATELDDDIGGNIARSSSGSTISGGSGASRLIDGIHTSSAGCGYVTWTSSPPGSMTLDLKVLSDVSRIRLLNEDWSYRVHRYRIESSTDGAVWSDLADASTGEHTGWEDWPVDRQARYLRFTGLSNSVSAVVKIAEWEVYGYKLPKPLLNRTAANVRENGEGRFFVRLDRAPAANATVAVAKVSGDADLEVKAGSNLVFTAANWKSWQMATLGAVDDGDAADGTATMQVSASGGAATVSARELDDDIGTNLALAVGGSLIAGGSTPAKLIDGVHTSSANYGYTVWTSSPPGSMTLELRELAILTRIRLLNDEWSERIHRYKIEGSGDGAVWSNLVDASASDRRGWDDWALANSAARYLRFTGLSNSVSTVVKIAEWEAYGIRYPRPVLSRSSVNVRENGEGRFFVKLDMVPSAPTTVTVAKVSGDADLTLQGGSELVFTSSNWDTWRLATLGAANDVDADGGTATFRASAPGGTVDANATELDDDVGTNLALASAGSSISGGSTPARLIDGVHTSSANYGYTVWTSSPPGSMTLDLKSTATVSRVRLLNDDWSYRVHQYRIESSTDGSAWSGLVDASTGEHAGWEDWPVDRQARYLRFTGLSNSASHIVKIAEWEVVGALPPARKEPPLAADGEEARVPVVVVTDAGPEDESGWAAVDGDTNTLWTGRADLGGWYIAIGYEPGTWIDDVEVDLAEGSSTNVQFLYSADALEWLPLPDDLEDAPVWMNYLWLLFPSDGSGAPPRVGEIRPVP